MASAYKRATKGLQRAAGTNYRAATKGWQNMGGRLAKAATTKGPSGVSVVGAAKLVARLPAGAARAMFSNPIRKKK